MLLFVNLILFRFNESTVTWTALHEKEPDFKAVLEGVSIFGHKTWTIFNDTKVSIQKTRHYIST